MVGGESQSASDKPEVCRPGGPSISIIHPNGFTLIELLVVIAALALLLAILVPALSRARKHAKAAVCLSHLKQWGTTFALYVQDNEGHLPPDSVNALWMLRGASTSQAGPNEPETLQNIRTEGIACCPMATEPPSQSQYLLMQNGQVRVSVGDVFRAWEITSPAPAFRGSYGMNAALFSSSDARAANFWMGGDGAGLETNVFSIQRMARIPVLLDSVIPAASGSPNDTPPPSPSPFARSRMGCFCLDRHNACVAGLFLDWSVRKIGLKELWTLKWHPHFNTAGRWTKAGGVTPEQWPKWMRGLKDY